MIIMLTLATLAVLALATLVGTAWLERRYAPDGEIIAVDGGALHVVDLGPRDAAGPAIVLIHGASANLRSMRPLGDQLAATHRVILIDRPGHGFSPRVEDGTSSPTAQAAMIDQALGKLGVDRAIIVVHSLAGALGALMPLNHPKRVAGLVMLAPVTHPWVGGVGSYNKIIATPLIGPLLAHTITLPIGLALVTPGARTAFAPQPMPENFVEASATPLLLRPQEFRANAIDLVGLKEAVRAQVSRYPQIAVPTVALHGDADTIASLEIHSRPFVAAVPHAKLIVLPNVGHMVQYAAPGLVVREIDAMIAAARPKAAVLQ
ncbi:pimeloyl-ACP methyl ester carboxylesterase [Rhodopseudomonas rhenobacensis]|uniref:Pimeloyl-ACP methyl ester carboxylesterase n=1 Tax=Rhodopseudomonas rhenobacensis TaxID=87461 RepID=A0A7W7Z4H5_9BRAD|nr:alpha/beta hydrolase [Rhodopseudomonas rhenobacensis]MBB5047472.1 pimeloyl-ACP methyl ester carboxylesterase [Rhodopseudomonas rhenobacensis]